MRNHSLVTGKYLFLMYCCGGYNFGCLRPQLNQTLSLPPQQDKGENKVEYLIVWQITHQILSQGKETQFRDLFYLFSIKNKVGWCEAKTNTVGFFSGTGHFCLPPTFPGSTSLLTFLPLPLPRQFLHGFSVDFPSALVFAGLFCSHLLTPLIYCTAFFTLLKVDFSGDAPRWAEGLSCALQWIHLSWREPLVFGMGQPSTSLFKGHPCSLLLYCEQLAT